MNPNPKLSIELLPDGNITINGPIDNKLLCYGMLESAKDAIREYVAKKNESQILRPALNLAGLPS